VNRKKVTEIDTESFSIRNDASSKSPYAYAYLLAGCDPSKPFYFSCMRNLKVSAKILRSAGSTSDIVVMVRMASWVKD